MELAGSHLAFVDVLETAAGCDSVLVSPFKFARSASLATVLGQRVLSRLSILAGRNMAGAMIVDHACRC